MIRLCVMCGKRFKGARCPNCAPPQTARTGIASAIIGIAAAAGVQIGAGYIALSDSLIAELHRAAFFGAVISAGAVAFAAAMAFIAVRFFRRR